jgi:hypothetical protein
MSIATRCGIVSIKGWVSRVQRKGVTLRLIIFYLTYSFNFNKMN